MNLIKIWPKIPPYFSKDFKSVKKNTNSQIVRLKWKQSKNGFLMSLVIHFPPFFVFFIFFKQKTVREPIKKLLHFSPFSPPSETRKRCCTYYLLQCRLSVPILYFPEINQNPLSNFPTVILTSRGPVVWNFIFDFLKFYWKGSIFDSSFKKNLLIDLWCRFDIKTKYWVW